MNVKTFVLTGLTYLIAYVLHFGQQKANQNWPVTGERRSHLKGDLQWRLHFIRLFVISVNHWLSHSHTTSVSCVIVVQLAHLVNCAVAHPPLIPVTPDQSNYIKLFSESTDNMQPWILHAPKSVFVITTNKLATDQRQSLSFVLIQSAPKSVSPNHRMSIVFQPFTGQHHLFTIHNGVNTIIGHIIPGEWRFARLRPDNGSYAKVNFNDARPGAIVHNASAKYYQEIQTRWSGYSSATLLQVNS